jgi:uncharacterized membrane protein YfcA
VKRVVTACLLGAAAGTLGGLFGIGGGLVMVPGMVLFLAIPQHRAHATSLAAMIASASAAVVPLALADRIDWDTGGFLLLGSIGGAYLGARIFAHIPEVWLAGGFVALALASAVRMFLEGDAPGTAATGTASLDASWGGLVGFVVIGFGAGVLGALMGIGGGIVYVPALVTLYGFEQHLAQGTSLAVIVPTAVVAAITHGRRGQVDWRLALLLGAGGLTGGWAGARLALALDAPMLRMLFASFLVLMALRMLWRTWRRHRALPEAEVPSPQPG